MRKNKTTHFMSGILILLFAGIFLVLVGRFLYIQATAEINNISLEEWADKKRTTSYTLDSERGKIFGKNGMTLAYDRPTFRIHAIVDETYTENPKEPMHVKNPEKTAEMLAPLLHVKESYILERLEKGINNDRFQVEFGRAGSELSLDTKKKIEKLDIPGIGFEKESLRYYPNGMFASRIIGLAHRENGKIIGDYGIENQMNDVLSGKDGYISYKRDKQGWKLLDADEVIKKPEDGNNVYLTIDQKIQTLLEDVMSQMQKKYEPKRMSAIVMDPHTGEVLAMSNRPSYNPNKINHEVKNWYNDAVSTPIEPGSTMKMFTWASAIEEGVYNGNELYKSGTYQVSDRVTPVHDHNGGKGWGPITYDEGFARSSNVAAAKLVWEKIGTEKFLDYLKAFDFDEKTGIDLPREQKGEILYNWPSEKLTTSFGQGTTVTPIQLMKAATAIANDGKMMKPYVISKVVDPDTHKVVSKKSPEIVGQPISEETADHVMNLMESVVSKKYGTGQEFKLKDFTVAGKTGTSQISKNGKYLIGHGNYIYSFLGAAPKDNPQLMMYVSVKKPELEPYELGSEPVAFIFKNVMEHSLHYLNINPDKENTEPVHAVEIPQLEGESVVDKKESLTKQGLDVTVLGSGETIRAASSEKGAKLLPGDRLILVTDNPTMPDITGWSARDVLQLADLLHLKVETMGHGYAVKQSIKEGTTLKEDAYLGVEFKPPNAEDNQKKENKKKQERN
ncbi:penicillin-binding protein [Virgibacillus siamensis]|uniref:penicillin-binding protein n=1 Tax=Virgibacillus siamensis TaxID=480071 RepID=UPI000986DA07|nr:penicillin-binding protein [Virgibacillus siamensis]